MLKPYNLAQVSFDFIREIGQEGKNSKTFIAKDHQLDADIVIKQIEKSKIDSIDLFFNESKLLYLSAHSNVVQIHYACQDDNYIYLAMPFYKNGSLNELINNKFLTVREIIVFGCQIASGLHNIHSKRLVHFDIKPDNILISDRGEALISDFGLSRRKKFNGSAEQDRLYSKMLPPEATKNSEHTHAFDIYQLGLTLYRMCNGNESFYSQFNAFGTPLGFKRDDFKFALINGRFPNRSQFLEHIPERLRKVIKKCLEPRPEDRFNTTIEVANALADIDGNILDWQYFETSHDRSWKKQSNGNEYILTLDSDGSTVATKSTASGHKRRINDSCKETASVKDIRAFLGGY